MTSAMESGGQMYVQHQQPLHQNRLSEDPQDLEQTYTSNIEYSSITAPCDLILEIEKKKFPCHRTVLASRIPYFKAMFTIGTVEQVSKSVNIRDIPVWSFESIHKYIYTGKIVLNMQNIKELLLTILFFQMDDLQIICENFIKERLNLKNVISYWKFAKCHHFPNIMRCCQDFVSKKFADTTKTSEFTSLDTDELKELCNSLNSNVEEWKKFRGLVQWMSAEPNKRVPQAGQLFSILRMHEVPTDELNTIQYSWKKMKISQKWFKMLKERARKDIAVACEFNTKTLTPTDIQTETKCAEMLSSNIYVLGGEHNRDCVSNVWIYGKGPSVCLPEKKMLGSAVVLNNTIVTAGGFTKLSWLSSVHGFNLESKSWFRLKSMITQLSVTGCCVINDYMYVCGGFNGTNVVSDVTRYSLVYDLWEPYPSMLSKREGLGVAAVNGSVYAVGGQTNISILDTMERYDPREKSWSMQKKMHLRRSAFGVASLDDNLYVCGGFDGLHDLSSLDVYNQKMDRWTSLRPMKYPRRGLQLVPHNGNLYAMGGYVGDNLASARVECYNPKLDSWNVVENLPTTLFSFSAVVL